MLKTLPRPRPFHWVLLLICQMAIAHDGPHLKEDRLLDTLGHLGEVNFAISCDAAVQQNMNTGVALLHHMMYLQAEETFQALIEEAPDCAMSYWGYAMSLFHPLWPDTISIEALELGEKALIKAATLKAISHREQLYLAAATAYFRQAQNRQESDRINSWETAQREVYQAYPDDIDAAAFYALAHLSSAPPNDKNFSQQKHAGSILDKLMQQSPTHPGVIHYTIHAYDNAQLAPKAIQAAQNYDQIAPNVPHALHMPSHIFVRLGMWSDVVSWNKRSATAALAYTNNATTSMHYVHALDYQVYAHLQLSEDDEASQAIRDIELHHPHQDTFPVAYALTAIPARYALERHDWEAAKKLPLNTPSYLSWDKFPHITAMTHFARGLGAARGGDLLAAKENAQTLATLQRQTAAISPDYWAILTMAQLKTVEAWIHQAEGKSALAIALMREAADLEDRMEKNPVTPGAIIPARELLADMLTIQQDFPGALKAYETTLSMNPNRLNSLYGAGHSHQHTGNVQEAIKFYTLIAQEPLSPKNERPNVLAAHTYLSKQRQINK